MGKTVVTILFWLRGKKVDGGSFKGLSLTQSHSSQQLRLLMICYWSLIWTYLLIEEFGRCWVVQQESWLMIRGMRACLVVSDSLRPHSSPGSSVRERFPRLEYWNGLPFPHSGVLPDPEIEPASLASPALAGRFFTTEPPGSPVTRGPTVIPGSFALWLWSWPGELHIFALQSPFFQGIMGLCNI